VGLDDDRGLKERLILFQKLFLNIYKYLVSDLPSDFFDNSFISASLDFFGWFGTVIFAFSFLLLATSTVERRASGDYVDVKETFLDIIKGFILLCFSRPLVIWSFKLAHTVAIYLILYTGDSVTLPGTVSGLTAVWEAIKSLGVETFISIIMFVMTIIVFFQILTLYGMYYIEIVTGYFYIADVMRGNLSAIEDWLRDVTASGITFALEYIFYIEGIAIMDANCTDLVKCTPGLVLIISSPAIPTALRKWGYSHGSGNPRGVIAGLGHAMSGTVSALTRI
jgi:hypothetical protein